MFGEQELLQRCSRPLSGTEACPRRARRGPWRPEWVAQPGSSSANGTPPAHPTIPRISTPGRTHRSPVASSGRKNALSLAPRRVLRVCQAAVASQPYVWVGLREGAQGKPSGRKVANGTQGTPLPGLKGGQRGGSVLVRGGC